MATTGAFHEPDELRASEVLSAGEWMPEDVQRALGVPHMPVIYYDETNHDEMIEHCERSYDIGLTFIRLSMGEIFLICLATEDKIYVLDLKVAEQLKFFKKLARRDIAFYSTRGDITNYRLHEVAGVSLENLRDLTSFDIFLTMRNYALFKMKSLAKEYTLKQVDDASLVCRDKYELIKHWLGVRLMKKDRQVEKQENDVIRDARSGVAARNVIRSRTCFNRELALVMHQRFREMSIQESEKLYSFAEVVKDEDFEVFVAQYDKSYSRLVNTLNRCAK